MSNEKVDLIRCSARLTLAGVLHLLAEIAEENATLQTPLNTPNHNGQWLEVSALLEQTAERVNKTFEA